jgi:hypothetical protein
VNIYRREKPTQTGSSPCNWSFYQELNKFLGSSAINSCEPVESVVIENPNTTESVRSDDESPIIDEVSDEDPTTAKRQRRVIECDSDSEASNEPTNAVTNKDSEASNEPTNTQANKDSEACNEGAETNKKEKRSGTIRRRPQSVVETIREELIASRAASSEISGVIRESLLALNNLIRSLTATVPDQSAQPQQMQSPFFQPYSTSLHFPYASNTGYQQFGNGTTAQNNGHWPGLDSNWSGISLQNNFSFPNNE